MEGNPSSPNGRHDLSIHPDVLIPLCWAGVALAAIFVTTRTYIRFRIIPQQKHIATDLWLYHAFAFLIVNAALLTALTPHINDINHPSPDQLSSLMTYVRLQFASMVFFWTILWCIKASFLALFYGFLSATAFRPAWYAVSIISFATWVGCIVVAFVTSRPLPWHQPSDFGMFRQHDRVVLIGYTTAADIFTDVLIMVLPLPVIWNTKLSRAQHWGLTGVFAVSIITIAFSIVRSVEILHDSRNGPVWCNVWSIVESSVAVIVGCLPSFKALFSARNAPSRKSYTGSRQSNAPLQGDKALSSFPDEDDESIVGVNTTDDNITSQDTILPLTSQSPRNRWSPFPAPHNPTRDSLPMAPSPQSFPSARGPIVAGAPRSPSITSPKNVSFGQTLTHPRTPSPPLSPPLTPPEEYGEEAVRESVHRPLRSSSDEPIIPEEMRDHSELDVWISRSFIVTRYC